MTNKAVKTIVSLLLLATTTYPFYAQAGVLGIFDWVKTEFGINNINNKVLSSRTVASVEEALSYPELNINNMNLLQSANSPLSNKNNTASTLAMVDGSAFTNENNSLDGSLNDVDATSDQISLYTVRNGDTIPTIAKMFGVTPNTIYWANDLKVGAKLKPDQVIIILPISGIKYTVKKGDSINSLAKKFKADAGEIVSFNSIDTEAGLTVGQEIIIPNAEVVATSKTTSSGQSTSGYFRRPINGGIKTQGLHGHNGVDLASYYGAPILAAADGEVIISRSGGWNGGYGNYVVIRHSNGMQTLYGHMSQNLVSAGEHVAKGQQIGKMGSTGQSTGTHLHFEVRGGKNPF